MPGFLDPLLARRLANVGWDEVEGSAAKKELQDSDDEVRIDGMTLGVFSFDSCSASLSLKTSSFLTLILAILISAVVLEIPVIQYSHISR